LDHVIYKLHNICSDAINAITVDYLPLLHSPDTQGSTFAITSVAAVINVRTQDIYVFGQAPSSAVTPLRGLGRLYTPAIKRWVFPQETWR